MHHPYAMRCIESVTPQGDLLIKFTSPLLSYALDIRWLRHVRRIPIMYRNAQCSHFLKALHMDISSSWPRSRKDCRRIYQAPWYIDIKRYFKLISSCFRSLISPSPPSVSSKSRTLISTPMKTSSVKLTKKSSVYAGNLTSWHPRPNKSHRLQPISYNQGKVKTFL